MLLCLSIVSLGQRPSLSDLVRRPGPKLCVEYIYEVYDIIHSARGLVVQQQSCCNMQLCKLRLTRSPASLVIMATNSQTVKCYKIAVESSVFRTHGVGRQCQQHL